MGEENWIETAEKITLFRNQGRGAEPARLLEISPTNRILVDTDQAVLLLINRTVSSRVRSYYPDNKSKYLYTTQIPDNVEEHQLTMDGKSREQFMKVAIAQYQGKNDKVKNELENLAK